MRKTLLYATAIAAFSIGFAVQAQERNEGPGAAPGKGGGGEKMAPSRAPGGAENTAPGGEQKGMQPRAEDQRMSPEGGKSRATTEENRSGKQSQTQGREGERSGAEPKRSGQAEGREKATTQGQNGGMENRQDRGERAAGEGREQRSGAQGASERGSTAQVTSEQKTRIRSSFKGANVREANGVNISHVSIGGSVPRTITEYWEPVPTDIVEIVPAWRSYRVVRVHGEILVIDPATFEIVYIM
jgi:hypothetical protein